jgi:heat-inducible transcriptional repressor
MISSHVILLLMTELTERQTKILKAIIEEYIENGEAVGSEVLEKKYELGVSPATIRNEMAKLIEAGFLKQPHTSAGRVPTKEAFRFYVDRLMEEKKLSVVDEVAAREKVWDSRFDFDHLMHQAVKALAKQTRSLALATTKEGEVYHAGYANILEMPEFYDIDITRTILSMLEEVNQIHRLFEKSFDENPVHLLFGNELGYDYLEPCGMVFTNFEAGPKKSGSLGIISSNRLNYPLVIPTVRYFAKLIEELASSL